MLEKQLEFDFMKENWLTDVKSSIKPYIQKGLKYAGYTVLGVATIPIILIGTAFDFVEGFPDINYDDWL